MEDIRIGRATPTIDSKLRHNILRLPGVIREASGIIIYGRRIKSLIFTTDLAIIRNCDADAVLAVYPFSPQQAIGDAIIKYSYIPVFCGVGGAITKGIRTVGLAKDAEASGAMGIVLNALISNVNLSSVSRAVDIPSVITVTKEDTNIQDRLDAGAAILNVAAAENTPYIVEKIRKEFEDVPIMASGGKTEDSIMATIEAGANAITYTPPSTKDLFASMMKQHRET